MGGVPDIYHPQLTAMRFTIRDWLWFTALVAIALAWSLNHSTARYTIRVSRNDTAVLEDSTTGQRCVRRDDAWVETTW
jgi:hypothetical protein